MGAAQAGRTRGAGGVAGGLAVPGLGAAAGGEGRRAAGPTELLSNRQLAGGLVLFFHQYLIQAGLFFTIPLYLSVALRLSAIDAGIRILPLSLTLLVAAAGIPTTQPGSAPLPSAEPSSAS